jgi:drug/metabolite transporter (DMT)-like permease
MMSLSATLFWLANLACDTVGQLSFKAASLSAGPTEGRAHWLALAKSPWLWLGIAAFLLELIFWLSFLAEVPLAMGLFVGSANIIGVMIGGRLLFGEAITRPRILAIGLITVGVMMVGWGGQ